jgi:transposase
LSAISAISQDGHLYFDLQTSGYTSANVVEFLKKLRRQIRKPLLIIWDGAPIHKGHVITDYLKAGAARYIQLEKLPGYAPELNPDEGVWGYLKRVELKNVCCANLGELSRKVKYGVTKLRRKRQVLLGCIKQVGLSL